MIKTKIILLLLVLSFYATVKTFAGKAVAAPLIYTDTLPAQSLLADTVKHVEIDADFPGGEPGWRVFLGQNLRPETPVVKGAPAGTYQVIVQFIVDGSGHVADIKPLTAFGYGMEEEVMRVIKKSPRWKPAVQGGKFVNAYRKQPVSFTVEEKKKRRLF